ncbi:MAG: MoaD/ThiS family protein [Bacillota bacterium]
MIDVSVLFKTPWMPGGQSVVSLEEGSTVGDMLKKTGIEKKQWTELLVVVNGKSRLPDELLEDGDIIVILPLMCGG